MRRHTSILAVLVTAASAAPPMAAEVFSSGTVPDLTDQGNFTYSDDLVFGLPSPPPDALYYVHFFDDGAVPEPVTVRSVEFYGYTEWVDGQGDPNHGFELNLDGSATVLNVVRTDVSPAFATDFGVLATPVQRIQVDIEPITFAGGSLQIRGETGLFADFFMALADPALAEITLDAYRDTDLTVLESTTVGAAFQFTLFDTFQTTTSLPGDANGDGTVDLLDLDILGANFGATAAVVPEPAAAALALIAAAGLTCRGSFACDHRQTA